MAHHILLATWNDSAKTYEIFTQLKNADIGNIHQAMIVERTADGSIKIQDETNNTAGENTIDGGLIGSLIGILGGPLGLLLGFSAGALIGSLVDLDQGTDDQAILAKISQALPIGSTGLILNIEENAEQLANDYFAQSEATLLRWDYDEVEAEIEASVESWEQANRQANAALRDQKKAENKAKRQEKWNEFKAKFHKI